MWLHFRHTFWDQVGFRINQGSFSDSGN
jgi:hypothetical protein